MSERIANLKGQIIVSGQHPGLPPQQIPLWETGGNVLFEDMAVKPAPGQSSLFVPLSNSRVTGMQALHLFLSGVLTPGLVWGTKTKLYYGVDPPNTVDATRAAGDYTGGDDDLWVFAQFGQAVLATNGKDKVQYLAPAATQFVDIDTVSDLPTTFRCRTLWVKEAYVLAFNTDNDPTEVRWCTEDDLTVWTPAAANSARDIQLRDLFSHVTAVADFADGIIVCGTTQAHFLRFIGAPFYFGAQHLIEGAGAVSRHAVVTIDRIAYGFGPDGIWETDGATLNQISAPAVHKYIYEDVYDATRPEQVVSWTDEDNVQVFWSFPTKDGLGETISFDRRQRVWCSHSYWRTAASRGGPWLFPVLGSVTGGIYGQGGGQGEVTGDPRPVGISLAMSITTGYGDPGYGGLGYGGSITVD